MYQSKQNLMLPLQIYVYWEQYAAQDLNLLTPNINLQILFSCPPMFLTEVQRRS